MLGEGGVASPSPGGMAEEAGAAMVPAVGEGQPTTMSRCPGCDPVCGTGGLVEIRRPQLLNFQPLPSGLCVGRVPSLRHVCIALQHTPVLAVVLLFESGLNLLEPLVQHIGTGTAAGKVLKGNMLESKVALYQPLYPVA